MSSIEEDSYSNLNHDGIDIFKLLSILWYKKIFIVLSVTLTSFISVQYALSLPNIYKSEAILLPQGNESAAGGGMLGQYSSIASFTGISLPSSAPNKSVIAIKRIESFEFFLNFFLPNISLQDLVAVKRWDPLSNKLTYDLKIFNSDKNMWVKDSNYLKASPVSLQESYGIYKSILSISQDTASPFISISIKHKSPHIAKDWVYIVVNEINKSMGEEDKKDATNSIEFLNGLALKVNYAEIKNIISSLQQEQIKNLMMIESNKDYIFKFLDSPVAPEKKSEPKRALIVMLGILLGSIMSIMVSIAIYSFKDRLKN
tara:strand:+ start:194 stop:1138 length:945 start_codon:yes stop_codon:yes gene_type:complete